MHSRPLSFRARLLVAPLLMLAASARTAQEGAEPVPVPAKDAILAAFEGVPLVALGERHDTAELHAFYLELVRDPRFRETVDDIVFEVANARHQDILDEYVTGEDVPVAELRRVWRDATNSLLQGGDLPHYEELLAAIRQGNLASPATRQLRAVAGDPPLDWETLTSASTFGAALAQRDGHIMRVIVDEVLGKRRKGLLIMGRSHLVRREMRRDHFDVIPLLERSYPGSVWVVHVLTHSHVRVQRLVADWKPPVIVELEGTWIAGLSPEFGYEREGAGEVTLGDTVDAVLYVGAKEDLHTLEAVPYTDAAYVAELERRRELLKELAPK